MTTFDQIKRLIKECRIDGLTFEDFISRKYIEAIIYGESSFKLSLKGKNMNFNEALYSLKNGKYVKRTGWDDGYCCLMPDQNYIWRILTKPQANVGNFLPLLADLLADDWETYNGNGGIIPPVLTPNPESNAE